MIEGGVAAEPGKRAGYALLVLRRADDAEQAVAPARDFQGVGRNDGGAATDLLLRAGRGHRDKGEGPLQATASALSELTIPLIGSTLTPIVVFLPLVTITGVTGTFFSALAIAMSVSLLSSLVLALVWTSNLSTRLIRRHGGHEEAPTTGVFARIIAFYERVIRHALRRPLALAALCVVLVAASYLSYRALGSDLLPSFDEGGFIIEDQFLITERGAEPAWHLPRQLVELPA